MTNKLEIPEEVEMRIRQRDKLCVYCGKKMIYPYDSNRRQDSATIERKGTATIIYMGRIKHER